MGPYHLPAKIRKAANQNKKDRDYWLDNLAGDPVKSSFPPDCRCKENIANQDKDKDVEEEAIFQFGGDIFSVLTKRCRGSLYSLHIYMAAGLMALLSRYTGHEDIIIGTPIYKQENQEDFINTVLALRARLTADMTFKELLLQVRDIIARAVENQNYPVELVVEQLNLSSVPADDFPLFDVAICVEGIHAASYLKRIRPNMIFSFRLQPRALTGSVRYNSSCYSKEMVKGIMSHFKQLLASALSRLDTRVFAVDILTETEIKRILYEFNNTAAEYPADKILYGQFEEQVERTPDRIAIIGNRHLTVGKRGNIQLSYRKLNEKAGQLAGILREKGIQADTVVGIMLERSIEMIIGILGILKAGGAYLPIDPGYPEDRKKYMLADSNARILLRKSEIRNPKSETNPNAPNSNEQNKRAEVTVLDFEHLNFEFVSNFEIRASDLNPSNLAYVIYTSGSTGKPKGTVIQHRSVVNRLNWMQKRYPLTGEDVILQKTPFTFDVSVWELFWWGIAGARLCLLAAGGEKDPGAIVNTIELNRVSIIHFVPSMLAAFMDYTASVGAAKRLSALKRVFASGEALSTSHVNRFHNLFYRSDQTRLINLYGPTEATVDVSYFDCSPGENLERVPIGKPIDNIGLFVLDRLGSLQPIDVPGELCITGVGLARGYLNRPELTAENFLARFYRSHRFHMSYISYKSYIYKTGDLARWLPDGNIEFLGRIDFQVKIRGFRIEPGEIENKLLAHEGIKEAVVIHRSRQGKESKEHYLCAYVVPGPGKNLTNENLREYLQHRLPGYMVPAHFMLLEKLPLTSNGKVDRKSLPEPEVAAGVQYQAPTGETAMALAKIWRQVLELEKIGVNDRFFVIGGDSIKAIKLIGSINNALGTNFEVGDIYSYQTIAAMTGHVLKQSPGIEEPLFVETLREVERFRERMTMQGQILETTGVEDVYPMSDIEKGIIFHYLKESGQGVYHDQITAQRKFLHFESERMKKALSLMIEKHPILRTGFIMEESAHVIYKCDESFVNDAGYFDISAMEKQDQEAYIKKYLEDSRRQGFDISKAPLWRIGFFKVASEAILLVWEFHHAIFDGWSNASFLTELNNTYHRLERDPGFKPGKLKVDYKQFITHQMAAKRNPAVINYWQDQLTGYKRLKFPPLAGSGQYKYFTFNLGPRVREQLEEMAKKQRTSLKHLCLGAFIYALSMFSYEPDITTGLVTHNRPESEDGDKILGCFINTVPFRLKIPAGITWEDYMGIVENRMVQLKKYEKLSLVEIAKLVGEASGHSSPFFDIIFNLVDFHVYSKLLDPGDAVPQDYRLDLQNFEQTNFLLEISIVTYGSQLTFTIHFSTAFISQGDAEKLYTFFNEVLKKFIHHPHAIMDKNEIIPGKERKRLLYDLNDTGMDYDSHQTIPRLFTEQAMKTPDNTAVVGPLQVKNRTYMTYITYRELKEKSNQLAHLLRKKGVGPDTIVAIMADRSIEMIVGIIGILKAGGAYLPIDPDYPEERKQYMLKDSGVKILLTWQEIADIPPSTLQPFHPSSPANLAYVIYTSGSTGKPKGVLVQHSSLINFVYAFSRSLGGFDPKDRCLCITNFTFDVSVGEIFVPLLFGSGLFILPRETVYDVRRLCGELLEKCITFAYIHPHLLKDVSRQLLESGVRSALKKMLVGVEPIKDHVLESFFNIDESLRVINGYGPTEATICTTFYRYLSCEPAGRNVPIGSPLDNTGIFLLDKALQLVPINVPGELCVGGAGLSRGYLNRPELTAVKFIEIGFKVEFEEEAEPREQIPNPKSQIPNKHRSYMSHKSNIYRTGDLARWLPDGDIEFLGRIDYQVKIRGFRIEPGEIENQLLNKTGIKNAVVVVKEDDRGDKHLCAYIVTGSDTGSLEVKEYLSNRLPNYMVPSYFVFLDKIPLTPNGKIDGKALPEPEITSGRDYMAPCDEVEKRLVEVWQDTLGIERVGIMDNFFQMGGDSIKAMQVVSRLKSGGLDLKINDLFSQPFIKQLAGCVTPVTGQIPQEVERGEVPLTPIQRWFFAKDFTAMHHFNQSVMLYWPGGIDQNILKQVFTKLIEHHDALRMVYQLNRETGGVIQRNRGIEGQLFDLVVFNFETDNNKYLKQAIENEADGIQAGIDLTAGPLVKLGLFKTPRGDHLLIVIHHLVIDGVSWRILLEDFNTAYRQVKNKESIRLPEKTDSFKHWSRKLTEHARKQPIIKSFCGGSPDVSRGQFFQKAPPLAAGGKKSFKPLPRDRKISKDKRKQKYTETVTLNLSEADTRSLLQRVNQAYHTEINDILLTALGKAVKEWAGIDEVITNLESHGREPIIPGLDISRTVGWFTAQYPVILDMSQCDDLSYVIKSVKETLRRIPQKGIEYGIRRYLTPRQEKKFHLFEEEPEISFNYLGQFDSPARSPYKPHFQFSPLSKGRSFNPELEQFHTLSITGMLVEGKLSLSFAYNRHEYDKATIRSLAKDFKRNLLLIIGHCSRKQERELTPSDVMDTSYIPLALEEFTGIVNHIKVNIAENPGIEAIYPLNPMQKGILYHWLIRTHYDIYMIQSLFKLKGNLEKSLLEASLNKLIQRYDIFRTIFIYQGAAEPLQVVLKHRQISVYYEDLLHLTGAVQSRYLEKWRQREKEKGFELSKDVMMRLSLFKTGENQYHLLWGVHHILMDGWCLGIIYNELVEIYRNLAAGKAARLEEVIPYRNYIEWLVKQDKAAGFDYWEKYLAGYQQQAVLPEAKAVNTAPAGAFQLEEPRYEISRQETAALMDFFSRHQVTLNTVIQGVWGLLLQRYNNSNDVVFGAVVSGRPAELPGVERMIGLFINTIPVRVISDPDQEFSQLVRTLQQNSTSGKSYEYLPLPDIQARSEVKSNLIDHILVFENYPLHQQVKHAAGKQLPGGPGRVLNWRVQDITVFEQTNYDFYITIIPGEGILVKLSYNSLVYNRDLINRVGMHIREIVRQVAADPGIQIKKIGILTAGEKRRILFDFNREEVSYPAEKTIHELFAEQVKRTPDNIAVVEPSEMKYRTYMTYMTYISYRELNERSNRLAYVLIEKGVQPDMIVGIMLERSIEMIIGILGILKAGGAYLPIDPGCPEDRKKYMLADSNAKILLTGHEIATSFGIWNSEFGISPRQRGQLAYIIYTSGSTGKPKGTVIQHGSVVNRLVWMQKKYPLTGQDVILQKTPITFDVSVWELFWWGIVGARCCLLVPGGEKDPGAIVNTIELDMVSVMHFVPSMLKAFMDYAAAVGAAARLSGLRRVFASGEALSVSHVNSFNQLLHKPNGTRLTNLYGPTEATVDVSYFDCLPGENLDRIPIGKPIDNIGLFVLDRLGRQQPIDVPGELCITGVGLARGYLNRSELTAERFLTRFYRSHMSNISYKSYIYKTGDLARWLPDGNIEFLGRIDYQVKIRGFRIEPGEIESRLLKKPEIKNAVVLAREDETGNSYLCAYIVTDKEILSLQLQEYLSADLPAYMIPAYFIPVDKVPLTSNGKIDRKALPAPGKAAAGNYAPPRNEVEKRLVELWQEVLGFERIGITDNFLAMGGDSIKAIVITSRLRKYGLNLKIDDIFAKPVIKKLAGSVTAVTRKIPQEVVRGETPLTPIQHWFFRSYKTHRNHFNQAIMLYRAKGFDENILRQVFTKLAEHHDALRMVFEFSRGEVEEVVIQKNRGLQGKLFELVVLNFENKSKSNIRKEIEEQATKIQGSMDLEKGPLVKSGLFKTAEGDHLLIAIHHLVMDGVSWRILLEDFTSAYKQAVKGQPIKFPRKTDSFKHWSGELTGYAHQPSLIKSFSGGVPGGQFFQKAPPLVRDREIDRDKKKLKYIRVVTLEINKADTQSLLKRVNRAYNTEINDILLTALGTSLKEWAGLDDIFIHLEGHGREPIIEDVHIDRTVGWFTALYPVILDMKKGEEFSYAIKSVKETLRRIPGKGVGYGILKYLTPGVEGSGYFFEQEPEIIFNYLGQFSSGEGADRSTGEAEKPLYEFSRLGTGRSASPELAQHYTLNINGMMVKGKLSLSFAYNRHEYDKTTIQALAKSFKRNLLAIIRHTSQKKERELTPSDVMDVSYLPLSLEEFKGILDYIKINIPGNPVIEAVYPLNPMQWGMFYHWLNRGRYDMYFIQTLFRLEGHLEVPLLETGFNKLIRRYDIFRTIFIYQGLEESRQVVLSHRQVRVYYEEIDHLAGEARGHYLEEWSQKEKERGFDLTKDVMMRLALFKTGESQYQLIWEFHHILMDGWCLGIVFNELVEIYAGLAVGKETRLEEVIPYGRYIEWWVKQDKEAGLDYWERYLAGYRQQASLPRLSTGKKGPGVDYQLEEYDFEIGEEETLGLTGFAGGNRVTLNTVFQALWGLVLQKYNNTDDIVFGAVVSGRPPVLPGVEKMVGLFINTIPVRVISRPDQDFRQLVKTIQQDSTASKSYEYLPLADIQLKSPIKSNLIDHILVFENYPLYRQVKAGPGQRPPESPDTALNWRVKDLKVLEQTNYNFNIAVVPGEHMRVKLGYNALVYDCHSIKRVEGHIKEILRQVLDNPAEKLKHIEILTTGEKQQILFEFNRTEVSYPGDKRIHELFAEQVKRIPGNIAVVGPPQIKYGTYMTYISYRELNQKSNQLAHLLRDKGVRPDALVGLMVERSVDMIIGLLGILKAGGAYLPIDPEYPRDRIDFMLNDSNAKILLTSQDIPNIHPSTLLPFYPSQSSSLAYVIYTSGTTARPKGVMVEQHSVVNVVTWFSRQYHLQPGVQVLNMSDYTFDASVNQVFGTLLHGASLHVISKDLLQDIEALRQYINTHCIHIINFVPTLLNQLLAEGEKLPGLQAVISGAEELNETLKNKLIQKGYALYNQYGPTETTIDALTEKCSDKKVTLGMPIANVQCYILDNQHCLLPIGVPGELYVAGAGVARGYLNRPELTAERFCLRQPGGSFCKNRPLDPRKNFLLKGTDKEHSPPYSPHLPHSPIYRTGDLARWQQDGAVEFLGRVDHQVKIRGFRIEPGEIQQVLLQNPVIKDAVVTLVNRGNANYLCAYIAAETDMDIPALRNTLSRSLPAYMVPAYFVPLKKIPLTEVGKVDRQALPEPEINTGKDYVPPRGEIETKLAKIWAEVLDTGENTLNGNTTPPLVKHSLIGMEDNFFELGGHSLKATILVSKIYRAFHVKVPLAEVFKTPTIRGLSQYLQASEQVPYLTIEAVEEKEFYPLSYNQKRLWYLHQLETQSSAYNMPGKFVLEHPVEETLIKKALSKMIQRHESTRTAIKIVNNEPVQQVEKTCVIPLETIDISSLNEKEQQKKLEEIYHLAAVASFNLEQAPLFKVILVKAGESHYQIIFSLHHVISDGWSMEILKKEFYQFYEGYRSGNPFKPAPLPIRYKDFAVWHSKQISRPRVKENSHRFWRKKLEKGVPALQLPVDFKKAGNVTTGAGYRYSLGKQATERLRAIALAQHTSLFMVVFSLYILLLSRFSTQEEITCSIIHAGREHSSLHQIVGFFVNAVLFHIRLDQGEPFFDFLQRVKAGALEVFNRQSYPLELVCEDLNTRYPEMAVSFNMINTGDSLRQHEPGSQQPRHAAWTREVKFDLEPYIIEYKNSIHIHWAYKKELFKPATIEYMANEYIKLVDFFTDNIHKTYKDYKHLDKKHTFKRN